DADATGGVPGNGAAEKGDRASGGQVIDDLGVGEPRVVVDDDVQVLVAGEARQPPIDSACVLAFPRADQAMAGAERGDPPEPLDVDVHELAWMATLVAVGRLERIEP